MHKLRSASYTRCSVESLEQRINLSFVITNTQDYDPAQYVKSDPNTYIVGSARWAVQKAMEAGGGDVVFDETEDLGNGAYFGGPIVDENIVKLEFGEIKIIDANSQEPLFQNISIFAPKHFDLSKNYVQIQRTGYSITDINHPDFKTDRSVLDITIIKYADLDPSPLNFEPDQYHPDYNHHISLDGLLVTGGSAVDGAGISATGFMTLSIDNCLITENVCDAIESGDGTQGGGIAALAVGVAKVSTGKAAGNSNPYGPILVITDTIIFYNHTKSSNDDGVNPPKDIGGGIYLSPGSSLLMSSSTVSFNSGENGGGGIWFGGGMFYENPPIDPVTHQPIIGGTQNLYSTYLKINGCVINDNGTGSPLGQAWGGGLVIAGPTGAMVADTTFLGNGAVDSGGAVYLTGVGGSSPLDPFNSPWNACIGTVDFISCTFTGNAAGRNPQTEEPGPVFGFGGAFRIDGHVNGYHIANCTMSENRAEFGTGGAISLVTSSYIYSFANIHDNAFNVDVNARTISLKSGLSRTYPIAYADIQGGLSFTEIQNCTISNNVAIGRTYDIGGKDVLFGARGGGIHVQPGTDNGLDGTIIVASTIVANNSVSPSTGFGKDLYAADDGSATITLNIPVGFTNGYNLAGVNGDAGLSISCQTGMSGTLASPLDPQLLPLNFYGGVVQTHALRYNSQTDHSPAVDRGINALGLTFDERNSPFDRSVTLLADGFPETVDVGAYELQLVSVVVSMTTWADALNTPSVPNTHSRINRIVLSFSQQVDVIAPNPADAFSLNRIAPSVPGTVTIVPVGPLVDTTSITLTFDGALTESKDAYKSLQDGWYQFKAFADDIISQSGEPIDGNNDNDPGDNFETPSDTTLPNAMYRLFGDIGTDHTVAANDFIQFRLSLGGTSAIFDFEGDGAVAASDFIQFRLRFGGSLP